MSNLSVSTLVGDPLNGGVITLNGYVRVQNISISNDVDSSSVTSGAMVISGGIGVGKNVCAGGDVLLFGAPNTFSSIGGAGISDTRGIIVSPHRTEDASLGASLSLCGTGLNAGNARILVPQTAVFSVDTLGATIAQFSADHVQLIETVIQGGITVTSTMDAVSSADGGAVTIKGGLSVAKTAYIGGEAIVEQGLKASTFTTTSSTDATGPGTGSIITPGGVSIGKSLRVAGSTVLAATSASRITVLSTDDTSLTSAGGIVLAKGLSLGGLLSGVGANFTDPMVIMSTVASTTVSSGALIVSGGAGVTGTVNAGNVQTAGMIRSTGTLVVSNPGSATTAVGTGAVVFDSGLSVSRAAYFGGNCTVLGTSQLVNATISQTLVITNPEEESFSATTGAFICTGGVGITGNVNINGDRTWILNPLPAADSTSGALVVAGGIGVNRNSFFGANVSVGGALSVVGAGTFNTSVTVNGTSTVTGKATFSNTTESVDVTTGAIVVSGGMAIAKRLTVKDIAASGSTVLAGTLSVTDLVSFLNATDSTSLTQASAVFNGGISVTKACRIGGSAYVVGSTVLGGTLTVSGTTQSTSTLTGAIVCSGGIGMVGSAFIGGALNVTGASALTSITVTGLSQFTAAASFQAITATSLALSTTLNVTGAATFSGNATLNGPVSIGNTTDASSATTGALVVSGGIGIAKQSFFNGAVTMNAAVTINAAVSCTSTVETVSSTTGAFVISGGLAVGKSVFVGQGLTVTGAAVLSGTVTVQTGQITLNTVSIVDASGLLTVASASPGFRVAGSASIKNTQYVNSIDLFALGNTYTDTNHESLQFTTTSTDTFTIMARNAGNGVTRKLVLQSGGLNTGQLALNPTGSVTIATTTDTTALGTGCFITSGGASFAKSVAIGGSLRLGPVTVTPGAASATYTLTLPTTLPAAANYALVSDTSGNLQWSEMVTSNPSFSAISVTSTTDATLAGQGSIKTAGGIYVAKSLVTLGGISCGGFDITLGSGDQQSRGSSGLSRALSKIASSTLVLNYAGDFTGGTRLDGPVTIVASTTDATSLSSGAFLVNGGVSITKALYCKSLTTVSTGFAAPSFTTRSLGTRLVLAESVATAKVDFALGVTTDSIWYSSADTTTEHRWYAGETKVMSLSGTGTLSTKQLEVLSATGTNSVRLAIPASLATSYTLTLPAALPSTANYALVTDTQGQLSFSEMVTANPTFTTVSINQTAILKGSTSGAVSIKAPATSTSPTFTLPSSYGLDGQMLTTDANGNLTWTDQVTKRDFSIPTSNNATGNVTGLITKGLFQIRVLVKVSANSSTLTAMYTLRGYPNATSTGYLLFQSFLGDDTGYTFDIDATGQIKYTSTNLTSWTSGTISWSGQDPYDKISNTAISANGANNVTTPTNVDKLILNPPQFSVVVLVTVNNTDTTKRMVAQYKLDGAYQPSGQWILNQSFTGPNTGLTFSITSSGQIQYTSTNVTGWLSTTFQFYNPATPISADASFSRLSVVDGGMTVSTTGSTGPLAMYHASAPSKKWNTGPDASGNYQITNDAPVGVFLPYGASSWSSTSDERLKKNISTIEPDAALDLVTQMKPVTFNYLEDSVTEGSRYGLIAQDLESVIPDLVTSCNGHLAISYTELIPILIGAVKELQKELYDIKTQLSNE